MHGQLNVKTAMHVPSVSNASDKFPPILIKAQYW